MIRTATKLVVSSFLRGYQTMGNDASQQPRASGGPACLETGEMVLLTVGDVAATCLVFRGKQDSAVLVPLQVTSDLQAALQTYPANATIKRTCGTTQPFTVDSGVSLIAVVATPQDRDTSTSTSTSQRQHVRLNINFKIEISTDGVNWHTTLGENISEGGLLAFDTGVVPLSIGQKVMFRIYLPGLMPIGATGVVKRTPTPQGTSPTPLRLAVQFLEISPEDADRIVGFIYRTQAGTSAPRST